MGIGLLGCPSFLVPIGLGPSFEDGVGVRSALRKPTPHTPKPPNPAGRGRNCDVHPPSIDQSGGSGCFSPPPAKRGQSRASRRPHSSRRPPGGTPSVPSSTLTLSGVLWFEPETQSSHGRQPLPYRRRDAASYWPLEKGTLIGCRPFRNM